MRFTNGNMHRPEIEVSSLAFGCLVLVALNASQFGLVRGQAQSNVNPFGDLFFYEGPGVLPGQIFRARGFHTEDHIFTTTDNYQIQLTRAWNPLLNGLAGGRNGTTGRTHKRRPPVKSLKNRIPILFVHGILESFNVFVVNSFGVKPRYFGNSSLGNISLKRAWHKLSQEPAARSLPLLALQFGHEVWLMSRRGFPGSQSQIGNPVQGLSGQVGELKVVGPLSAFLGSITDYKSLTRQVKFSINKRFWNFSLDEQAKYDLPQAIDYVLNRTSRKQLSVVGHSAGGALTLMALSLYPKLNEKINSAILWSQAFSLGRKDLFQETRSSRPLLEEFVGSVPPTFTTDQLQAIFALFCTPKLAQATLCEGIGDLILGPSFGQQPLRPEFLNSLLYSSSSHELAQLLQNCDKGGQMHMFDYGPEGNLLKYGQDESPAYDLSRVSLRNLSFYEGSTDFTVSPDDVEATRRILRVPNKRQLVPGPFNHQGYFFHKDNAELAVIPSLREIHQFSET